jgi:hypothetical protein
VVTIVYRFLKKDKGRREIFGYISAGAGLKIKGGQGPNANGFTMNFSLLRSRFADNIAAVLGLVDGGGGGGLVEDREWDGGCWWSPGGTVHRAGRQVCLLLWARGRAWARAFRM